MLFREATYEDVGLEAEAISLLQVEQALLSDSIVDVISHEVEQVIILILISWE